MTKQPIETSNRIKELVESKDPVGNVEAPLISSNRDPSSIAKENTAKRKELHEKLYARNAEPVTFAARLKEASAPDDSISRQDTAPRRG